MNTKEESLIDEVIRSSNPLFFGKLARLLRIPYPESTDEKRRVLKRIVERFHHTIKEEGIIEKLDRIMAVKAKEE